jgi:hypothetical protein
VLRLLVVSLALALLVPARADAKVTCDSGKTVYKHGHTRVFALYRRTEFYACSAVLRRPRLFAFGNDGTVDDLAGWKTYGRRLAFTRTWVGGDALGWDAGWVDLHTGAHAEATIQPDTDIPFAETGQATIVAPDGSIAFLEQVENSPAQVIGYAQFGTRTFQAARVLTTLDTGDVAANSLAFAGGTVTWKTHAGVPGSAPIS